MAAASRHEACPQEGVNPLDRALERAKAGDADAFRDLVEAVSPEFIGLLMQKLCPDEDTASSVLQDAWMLSWPRLSAFDSTTHLRQWVYRVSANKAVSLLRRGIRERKLLGRIATGARCSSFRDLAIEVEHPVEMEAELVREAIERLPKPYRPLAVLSFLYGCGAAEISSLLGLSKAAIKMRLHRTRGLLRSVST